MNARHSLLPRQQPAIFETDPKRPVMIFKELRDPSGIQLGQVARRIMNETRPVKPNQPDKCADPEITVSGLDDRVDDAVGEALFVSPVPDQKLRAGGVRHRRSAPCGQAKAAQNQFAGVYHDSRKSISPEDLAKGGCLACNSYGALTR